jgi:hypothetical protein
MADIAIPMYQRICVRFDKAISRQQSLTVYDF